MVKYEWAIEYEDSYEDVVDSDYFDEEDVSLTADRLLNPREVLNPDGAYCTPVLRLVRYDGDEDDGEREREYAEVELGKLPVYMDGGARIPNRIHQRLRRINEERETRRERAES